jgi:hypothetical protein
MTHDYLTPPASSTRRQIGPSGPWLGLAEPADIIVLALAIATLMGSGRLARLSLLNVLGER